MKIFFEPILQKSSFFQPLTFACLFGLFAGHVDGTTIHISSVGHIQEAIEAAPEANASQFSTYAHTQETEVISKHLNRIEGKGSLAMVEIPDASKLIENGIFETNSWSVQMMDNQLDPSSQPVNMSHLTIDGESQQEIFADGTIIGTTDKKIIATNTTDSSLDLLQKNLIEHEEGISTAILVNSQLNSSSAFTPDAIPVTPNAHFDV